MSSIEPLVSSAALPEALAADIEILAAAFDEAVGIGEQRGVRGDRHGPRTIRRAVDDPEWRADLGRDELGLVVGDDEQRSGWPAFASVTRCAGDVDRSADRSGEVTVAPDIDQTARPS